jgi:hypothetical protein
LPIISPDILLKDSPKSVVIMAAGYSDEIANIILEKYLTIENIAILREDRLEIMK